MGDWVTMVYKSYIVPLVKIPVRELTYIECVYGDTKLRIVSGFN